MLYLRGMGKFGERAFSLLRKVILYYLLLSLALVLLYKFVNPPLTPLMLIRFSEQFSGNNKRGVVLERKYVSYANISPYLVQAVVASEDQKFPYHFGFDLQAMEKAYYSNKKGKKVKGGSTISQQVAKNVFLWPGRSYVRKFFEAYFTVLIEFLWSKERIMEVYLNVIEMGNGVYGAEAASEYYFRKPAAKLSRSEAALLAAVLPNPRRFSAKNPSVYTFGRQIFILKQMVLNGPVTL